MLAKGVQHVKASNVLMFLREYLAGSKWMKWQSWEGEKVGMVTHRANTPHTKK